MYCTKCGSEITQGTKFCSKCGNTVEFSSTQIQKKINTKIILFALIGVVLCFAIYKLGVGILTPAYEKPVAYYMESLEKENFELYKKIIPDFIWEDIGEEEVQNAREIFEEKCSTYPRYAKVKYEVTNKYPLSADDLEDARMYMSLYTDNDMEITEGYDLMLQYTIDGMKSRDEVAVLKINGKWYINMWY